MVIVLIESGAEVHIHNKRKETPLMWAVSRGNDLFFLKKRIFFIISTHFSILLVGYDKAAQLLIQKGVHINFTDKKGRTPLMYAATGYSPSKENNRSCYVFFLFFFLLSIFCSFTGNRRHIETTLIEHGANIHARDVYGNTALILAAKEG